LIIEAVNYVLNGEAGDSRFECQYLPNSTKGKGSTRNNLKWFLEIKNREPPSSPGIEISNSSMYIEPMHYALTTQFDRIGRTMKSMDTDSFEIKIDNCCSRSLSGNKSDFQKGTLVAIKPMAIEGYSTQREYVTHEGTIVWSVHDDDGKVRKIVIPNSLYVPTNKTRLLSPQHLAQTMKLSEKSEQGTRCITYADRMVLQWNDLAYSKTVPINRRSSNIGRMFSATGFQQYNAFAVNTLTDFIQEDGFCCFKLKIQDKDTIIINEKGTVYEDARQQVDEPTKVNIQFKQVALLSDEGIPSVERDEATTASPEDELLRWHHRMAHVSMSRLQKMALQGYLPTKLAKCRIPLCQACVFGKMTRRPWRSKATPNQDGSLTTTIAGQCVSVDQLESPIIGFFGQMKGSLTKSRYKVATIFVDHYSNLSFVSLQTSTNAEETLRAKHDFERYASTFGVDIQHYHADNGRFAENAWKQDVLGKHQRLTFSGVGAHHQNGRAEKRIRDIQDMARTSLIHANRRWPRAVDVRLWPYALRHSNHALNHTPFKGEGQTPIERFSGTKSAPDLDAHHPFGCPAYALDGKIQSGNKAPKWDTRARLAIYIGPSTQHARTVGLLLSLTSGLVSPQFHVRYDDTFETLKQGASNVPSNWQQLSGLEPVRKHQVTEAANIPPTQNSPVGPAAAPQVNPIPDSEGALTDEAQPQIEPADASEDKEPENVDVAESDTTQPISTRSGRTVRAPVRFKDFVAYSCDVNPEFYDEGAFIHPVAYAASSDPDVMYLHQAMAAPDRAEFVKAMEKEVSSHTSNSNWKIIERKHVPPGHKVLPAVWAMRRKRDIETRQVYKWKARLNIHGGKQEKGVNYWDTYAPVASWSSIRIVLIMAQINNWKTKQLDFVLAFPQAPVETDLFMEIPTGFEVEGSKNDKVLKLVNNLYGQKQAGRVWNIYLSEGLVDMGFTVSKHDPCIFWRETVVIIIYTDDTIVTGPSEKLIKKAILDIGSRFEITSKDAIEDFLGVKIVKDEVAGTITLSQPHLIDSILADLGLDETSNTRALPALSSKILQRFDDSISHNEDWHYRSVVGKLNYLEKSSRPDIAYAVHQCARFSENPKLEHSKAVKLIGRYLLSTRTQGIVFKPTAASFECYCDADFSGAWNPTTAEHDSSTARSRSGYIVFYAGCPVLWASRLQTEIALSSTESEYISLSQSLREVIPLMRLITELRDAGFDIPGTPPKVHCKTFEDNSGALEMARTPKLRPRTKHINIKYHHFREAVQRKEITIWPIDTLDQIADIFTKPLGLDLFTKLRTLIMGW
jgi:Reverse transcriptase (RNA-dependent DNA polymerase)/GAG-pre-integrase domain